MPAARLLLDSPSLAYRAFFALPSSIRGPDGRPVNAVRGYLDMVSRLVASRRPSEVVHTFDDDWRPAVRVAAYPGYKAQRRPDPDDLPEQFALLDEVLDAAGATVVIAPGLEADDALGTLAAAASLDSPVEIVSGDRDLLQLVRDGAVTVLFTERGVTGLVTFDAATVRARYGVEPGGYADMAILRGDPSDDLPGVRGIGSTTAARLIAEHGSLDRLLADPTLAGPRAGAAIAAAGDYIAAMRRVVPIITDATLETRPGRPADLPRLDGLARAHSLERPVQRMIEAFGLLAATA